MKGLPLGQSLQHTGVVLAHMVMVTQGQCKRVAGMGSWHKQANKAWQGKCGPANAAQAGRQVKLVGLWSGPVRLCGGSAVVPAALAAGSDLTYGLPPNLSPLPVSVHTHSLNMHTKQPNLAHFYFIFFLITSSPKPPYCLCPANLSCPSTPHL